MNSKGLRANNNEMQNSNKYPHQEESVNRAKNPQLLVMCYSRMCGAW